MFHRFFIWLESLFNPPKTTVLDDAIAGLEEAEKQTLTEDNLAEYAAAQVVCHKAMAEYQKKRVARLQAFIVSKQGLESSSLDFSTLMKVMAEPTATTTKHQPYA